MKKFKVYGIITALMIIVSVGLWMLSGYITYPTAAHKDIAQQRAALNEEVLQGKDIRVLQATTNYNELEESAETRYSTAADFITLIAQFVAYIGMIVAAYWYLRKRRIANKPVLAVILIAIVQTIIMVLITTPLSDIFYYKGMNESIALSPVLAIIGSIFSIGFTLALTFVVLKITEWQFNRRYGFSE